MVSRESTQILTKTRKVLPVLGKKQNGMLRLCFFLCCFLRTAVFKLKCASELPEELIKKKKKLRLLDSTLRVLIP
jgi:hypothetical protein